MSVVKRIASLAESLELPIENLVSKRRESLLFENIVIRDEPIYEQLVKVLKVTLRYCRPGCVVAFSSTDS